MKDIIVLLALLLSVGMLACEELVEEASPTPRTLATATPKPPAEQLALISAGCTLQPDIGYTECTGFVENISGKPLDSVLVVILWYDEAGTPITSDDALIDYRPILAGQQSPWSTIGNYNPAMTTFRIEFKEFWGGTIPHRDDRPD